MCVRECCVHGYAQNVALFLVTAHLPLTCLSLGSRALASCTLGPGGGGFSSLMLFEWKRKRAISSNAHQLKKQIPHTYTYTYTYTYTAAAVSSSSIKRQYWRGEIADSGRGVGKGEGGGDETLFRPPIRPFDTKSHTHIHTHIHIHMNRPYSDHQSGPWTPCP